MVEATVNVPVPGLNVPLLENELPLAKVRLNEEQANVPPEPMFKAPFMVTLLPKVTVWLPVVERL